MCHGCNDEEYMWQHPEARTFEWYFTGVVKAAMMIAVGLLISYVAFMAWPLTLSVIVLMGIAKIIQLIDQRKIRTSVD